MVYAMKKIFFSFALILCFLAPVFAQAEDMYDSYDRLRAESNERQQRNSCVGYECADFDKEQNKVKTIEPRSGYQVENQAPYQKPRDNNIGSIQQRQLELR